MERPNEAEGIDVVGRGAARQHGGGFRSTQFAAHRHAKRSQLERDDPADEQQSASCRATEDEDTRPERGSVEQDAAELD
ncbi:MAG TPA: hypothetical protein VJN67_10760 [Stellaceae bacterium]|nr:hypothetical protein [Stellaceae bacterium]